ncbi:PSMD10, partial [Symbiodinium microadriaticum]
VQRVLLGKPHLVNAQPCGRFSALHQASQANNAGAVSFLLEARADVNAKTSAGQIAADLATDKEVKALLHGRHAQLSARQDLEHQFLNLAKARKWKELAGFLAEVPDLARAQPGGRWSALHQAASAGHLETIRLLLSCRADTTARNSDGKTPVEVATAAARPLLELIDIDSSPEREGEPSKRAKTDSGPSPNFSRLEASSGLAGPRSLREGGQ